MSIIKKLRKESSVFVPNVLDKVLDRVGYLPTPKQSFWSMKRISVFSMSAAMTVAAAIVVPYYVNKAVVADALTTVEMTITPASAITDPEIVSPIFVFQVDKLFLTQPIDSDGTNAVYAKNENARIILAGVGRQNTTNKPADQVAVDIIDKAATAGYIELAGKGNVVTVIATGKNAAYCMNLEEDIYNDITAYFRERYIYGVVDVDDEATTSVDFTGYDESADEADTEEDENNYDTSATEHGHDDDHRDEGWENSYDSWMTEHDNHGHDGSQGGH